MVLAAYEYLNVALGLIGDEDEQISFDVVNSPLLQKEQRATMRDQNSTRISDNSALLNVPIQHGTLRSYNNRSNKFFYKCTNCGKFGHTKDRFWGKHLDRIGLLHLHSHLRGLKGRSHMIWSEKTQ